MQLPLFDKAKPFFPLVMNFAAQMIGFKETMALADLLVIRIMTKKISDASNLEGVPFQLIVSPSVPLDGYDLAYHFKHEFRAMLLQTPNLPLGRLLTHTAPFEVVGPRALKCLTQQEGIEFFAEEIASVYLAGTEQQAKALGVSAGSMIVSVFESVKALTDDGPVWEFFRHCRNAAAHGGRFNLLYGEPSRTAALTWLIRHESYADFPLVAIGFFESPR